MQDESMQEYILITGGSGYIGTHTCVELIEDGYAPLVYDNFSNSSREALERVEEITNTSIPFVEGDVRSRTDLQALFRQYPIRAVIHFAGLKAVGESVQQPS